MFQRFVVYGWARIQVWWHFLSPVSLRLVSVCIISSFGSEDLWSLFSISLIPSFIFPAMPPCFQTFQLSWSFPVKVKPALQPLLASPIQELFFGTWDSSCFRVRSGIFFFLHLSVFLLHAFFFLWTIFRSPQESTLFYPISFIFLLRIFFQISTFLLSTEFIFYRSQLRNSHEIENFAAHYSPFQVGSLMTLPAFYSFLKLFFSTTHSFV